MADYSKFLSIVNGVQRTIDLQPNALIVGSLKVGSVTQTELTKAILDNLVSLQNGSDIANTLHHHDGRYYTETEIDTMLGNYIKKDGTVAFTGNQSLGGFKLTSLAAGSANGDSVRYEQVIHRDGSLAFTANQSMGGFSLTNLANPTSAQQAATKAYVDSVAEGLRPKEAVRAATTANITLSGTQTIDGIALSAGERVLVKNQSTASENGIYVVAAGAWSRSSDFDSLSPVDEINRSYIAVQEGTANAGKIFVQYGTVTTLGTDAINFVFFNSNANLVGGDGITVSGTNISIDHDGEGLTFVATQLALELDGSTLSKSATGLKVAALGITASELASDSVTTAKILDANVTAAKLASDSVTTAKIVDANVTAAKLASDSVTTAKIVDANVTTAKIADDAVTKAKIAADVAGLGLSQAVGGELDVNVDGSTIEISVDTLQVKDAGITAAKLAADSVTTAKIVDANVTAAKLASDSVTTAKIVDANVTAAKLASDSVTTAKIVDANVTTAKIADDAVTKAKIAADVAGAGLSQAVGGELDVAYAPSFKKSMVAGESFAANTSFMVRMAISGETAGRIYKADKDASVSDKFYVFGVVMSTSAISAADPVQVTLLGEHTLGSSDSAFGAGDIGKAVYLTASGAFSVTAPSASNEAVYRIGVVQETNKILMGTYQLNGIM